MDERLSKLEDQNIEMVDITKEATKESELATKVNLFAIIKLVYVHFFALPPICRR